MLIFFSDIHGNIFSFRKFLDEIDVLENITVIFGGDVLGYYYDANLILDELRVRGIRCVLGNHDQYFLDLIDGNLSESVLIEKYGNSYKDITTEISALNVKFLRSLPLFLSIELCGRRVAVMHGSPNDYLNGRIYPDTNLESYREFFSDYEIVLLGHSHHKMLKKINKTTIINPGSLGQQRDGKGCSYVIINLNSLKVDFKVVDYDLSDLIKMVKKNDPDKPRNLEVLTRKRV